MRLGLLLKRWRNINSQLTLFYPVAAKPQVFPYLKKVFPGPMVSAGVGWGAWNGTPVDPGASL